MAQFAEVSSLPALPESPQQDLAVQLAALQDEMARLRAENALPREALIAPKDDEAEAEKPKEEEATGVPVVPGSFLMTP